jgi:hypothetical protein
MVVRFLTLRSAPPRHTAQGEDDGESILPVGPYLQAREGECVCVCAQQLMGVWPDRGHVTIPAVLAMTLLCGSTGETPLGVYALYDEGRALQYVGYARNIVRAVKVGVSPGWRGRGVWWAGVTAMPSQP